MQDLEHMVSKSHDRRKLIVSIESNGRTAAYQIGAKDDEKCFRSWAGRPQLNYAYFLVDHHAMPLTY